MIVCCKSGTLRWCPSVNERLESMTLPWCVKKTKMIVGLELVLFVSMCTCRGQLHSYTQTCPSPLSSSSDDHRSSLGKKRGVILAADASGLSRTGTKVVIPRPPKSIMRTAAREIQRPDRSQLGKQLRTLCESLGCMYMLKLISWMQLRCHL